MRSKPIWPNNRVTSEDTEHILNLRVAAGTKGDGRTVSISVDLGLKKSGLGPLLDPFGTRFLKPIASSQLTVAIQVAGN
jgi:hypothetical protein